MSERVRIEREARGIARKKQEIERVRNDSVGIDREIKLAEGNSNNDDNRNQINQAVENELNKPPMQRKRRGRNEEIRLEWLLGYSNYINIRDSVESAWAFVEAFFQVFKESRDRNLPFAQPQRDLNRKIFEKISAEIVSPQITISKDVAPYLLKFLSSLYSGTDASSLLEENDWISLYYLDDALARKLRRAIEDVLRTEDLNELEKFEELLTRIRGRFAGAGLVDIVEDDRDMLVKSERGRRRVTALQLEDEEIRRLSEFWTRILKAQLFARQSVASITDPQQREQRLREIEEEIEMIDSCLFLGNRVGEIKRIIDKWARERLIPPNEIDNVVISDSDLLEFERLNEVVTTEEEMFFNRYLESPFYNLKALNIQPEDFTKLSYRNIAMHFTRYFEWDRERDRLVMKNDVLYAEALRVLYKILRSVARYPQEEWSRSFDQTMEGMAIKLLRFSVTRVMMKVDEGFFDKAIEEFLKEQGIHQITPEMERRVKEDFKEMMAKLRVLIDEELSAQIFSHEFFRLFITDQLRDLENLRRMYQQFGANKATAVFGGLHKELIDLAARTFEGWLQHVIARNGNEIGPELFASIFTKQDLTYSHHAEEAYRIYRRIVDQLLQDNPSFREMLGIEEEGINDFIDRAWHLGLVRSMMERAMTIIAAMEPRKGFGGYPLAPEIMGTYNPRHNWLLGRGDIELDKILKFILLKEVREKGPKGLREIWRSKWIPTRVKKWMDERAADLWNWAEGKRAESLEALIEEVGEINRLIAEKMVAIYGVEEAVNRVMYWMQRFSLPGVEDRGSWRVETPLKKAYEDALRDLLGRDLWKDYRQDWEDITRYWGTGFLWETARKRVEEEIKESILSHYLGANYRERYRDSAIENKYKEILSSDRIYPGFRNLQNRELQISIREFVERKTWLYKGKIFYMFYKRSPVEFLNIVTRLVPALDNLYVDQNGNLLPTHEVIFEYDFDALRNALGLEEAKKVLEVRDKIRQEWSGYTLPYLKQVARAWWDLRRNTFELLQNQGKIDQQESWERDGRKYKNKIDDEIAKANLLLTRRLLAGKLDDRKLTIEDYVATRGLDSLTEEEKVIYRVFFDSSNRENIDQHFGNINFADGDGQELMVYDGERDFFTYTVNLWWKKNGEGIPSTIDTDRSEIERYISLADPRVYERDINDRISVSKYINEFIGLSKALKHMASSDGDHSKLQEVLSAASSYLKGVFGSDFVYDTNEIIIEAAAQFHLEHYISRALPFPFDAIARLILGKENSISRLLIGKFAYAMNDEAVREFVREMVKKGHIKEEHQKRIEQRLMLADNVYGLKVGFKILWLITLVITFYMIKKALEEETEEKG